jgi:hypothetical protein
MSDFYLLKDKSRIEIYKYIDKNIRKLPRNDKGDFNELSNEFINNDVDALRHAYVSGVYTLEYNETVSDILGRLNELTNVTYGVNRVSEENMDLWNNAVGRKYGGKSKNKAELIQYLMKALNNKELIIDPSDKKKYDGPSSIKRKPKSLVIVIEESDTGENLTFYDINTKEVFSKINFVSLIQSGNYPDYSVKVIQGKETPVSKKDRFNFNNLG